jgi:hypothetical protein
MATHAEDRALPLPSADGPGARVRRHWRGLLVAFLAMALGVALVLRPGGEAAERRALERMAPLERQALYQETLRSTESICAQAGTDEALVDRCMDNARFLLAFPECDDACRAIATTHQRLPTR